MGYSARLIHFSFEFITRFIGFNSGAAMELREKFVRTLILNGTQNQRPSPFPFPLNM